MGGLVARRAAGHLGSRLRGLLLADTLPETSPVYDTWDRVSGKIDRMLAVTQGLSRLRPLAPLFARDLRRLLRVRAPHPGRAAAAHRRAHPAPPPAGHLSRT